MNRRSLLISAGAAALAGCANGTPAGAGYPHAARIDAAAAQALAAARSFPGLAIAIYTREGGYARAFGVADIDTGEVATADTAFYIASTTKPVTSLALAKLQASGAFDLDATLASYAPDAAFPASVRPNEATFRHLLTHTHGISNSGIANRVAYTGMHDPETLWRLLGACTAKSDAPLGAYQYTNVGYNIATVLTDRRMGVAWQDLLQREVFGPAGMTRTSGRMSDARDWQVARPHILDPERGVIRTYLEKTDQTMQSAGGVIMSAKDALRWLELMCEDGRIGGRQIVPADAVRATRAPFADTGDEDNGVRVHYGLGWNVTQHLGEPGYYHSGGFSGFRSNISYLPQRGVGVALFANDVSFATAAMDALMYYVYALSEPGADADGMLRTALETVRERRPQFIDRMRQDRANRAQRPWTLTRPRAAYAGAYASDIYGPLRIIAEGEALRAEFGVLRAVAEPFTRPESIRLEFVPGEGTVLQFEGDEPQPATLIYQEARFQRV
jgi:CubicO group peptidase (beta-lactamase class C family)